jgi:GT2 family glycosyltransferase
LISNERQDGSGHGKGVSVIICTYTETRWSDLEIAVESISRQSLPPLETVVVVDNNEALFERASRRFPDVKVVEHTGARGAAGARNTAVAAASGSILAFLDDDAYADPDWLDRLVRWYEDPSVASVGGAILPSWKSPAPDWFPPEFLWVLGCTYSGLPQCASDIRNLIAANMSVRRSVFDELGGFNEDLGRIGRNALGCEETEFCIRLQAKRPGLRVLYDPDARVWQHVPDDRANWRYFFKRCFAEGLSKANMVRLVGSRDGLSAERAYTARVLSSAVVRAVGEAVATRDVAGIYRAAAITSGLCVTAAGYLRATLAIRTGGV